VGSLEVCARRHGFVRGSPEQEVAEDAVVLHPEAAVADVSLLGPHPAGVLQVPADVLDPLDQVRRVR